MLNTDIEVEVDRCSSCSKVYVRVCVRSTDARSRFTSSFNHHAWDKLVSCLFTIICPYYGNLQHEKLSDIYGDRLAGSFDICDEERYFFTKETTSINYTSSRWSDRFLYSLSTVIQVLQANNRTQISALLSS